MLGKKAHDMDQAQMGKDQRVFKLLCHVQEKGRGESLRPLPLGLLLQQLLQDDAQ